MREEALGGMRVRRVGRDVWEEALGGMRGKRRL